MSYFVVVVDNGGCGRIEEFYSEDLAIRWRDAYPGSYIVCQLMS